jgi:hypothetical protein
MKRSFPLRVALVACILGLCSSAYGQSFSNTNPITINAQGAATPYPSTINVSGLTGNIQSITIQLTGVSHTFPDDFGAIVVGPTGANVVLFDGAGDGDDIVSLNWLFDDAAASPLPNTGILTSGTFRPGQNQYNDDFSGAGGAPGPPYGTNFSGFVNTNGNGTWSLFVADFVSGDGGSISGGWTINIQQVPEPSALALAALVIPALLRRRRP